MNSKMKVLFPVGGILLVPVIAIATPPFGILSNIIWGTGTVGELNEHLVVQATVDDQEDWTLDLTTTGNSAFTTQEVVTAPGGYSGWHHHPGLLGGIVKEGTLSWYDQHCVLHSYSAGQSFVESTQAHKRRQPWEGQHQVAHFLHHQGGRTPSHRGSPAGLRRATRTSVINLKFPLAALLRRDPFPSANLDGLPIARSLCLPSWRGIVKRQCPSIGRRSPWATPKR
jgi:hypothetical protein